MASAYSITGSAFFVPSSEWGEPATWPGPGITLPAGQRRVLTVRGEVQGWRGAPVVKFLVRQGNASVAEHVLPLPVRDPGSAADDLGGLVYGDLDGDNAPDAGEALHGVRVTASTNGPPWPRLEATTGVEGRFRFADLPVQVYALSLDDAPDGWVVGSGYSRVAVDGRGSAATLLLRARRPLTDHLSAAMRFTRDVYQVGDQAQVEVTPTNSGAADLTGVKAACDRVGGGGPELRDVVFGELGWDAPGVTVPAGRSRVVTMTGRVSEATVEYGAVDHVCDFGPAPDSPGRPEACALAKVPGPAVTARMSFHHDRDGDRLGEPDEVVAGAVVVLRDAVTRRVVVEGRTDARGRVRFDDLPSGPCEVRVHGSWKLPSDGGAPCSPAPATTAGPSARCSSCPDRTRRRPTAPAGDAGRRLTWGPVPPVPPAGQGGRALADSRGGVAGLGVGYGTTVDKTDGQDYTDRLARLQNLPWKRVLNVQAPYRWNVRRIFGEREVLDVGCGIGRNLKHLEPNGVGVDHNPHSVQTCRDMGLTAFTTDEFFETEYAKPGRFGGILAAHLVEHMPRPQAVDILRGYVEFLKPGGLLVLICPQERGYASDPTHVAFTDLDGLADVTSQLGLVERDRMSFPFPRSAGKVFTYNEFVHVAVKPAN